MRLEKRRFACLDTVVAKKSLLERDSQLEKRRTFAWLATVAKRMRRKYWPRPQPQELKSEKTFACSDIAARRKNLPRMDSMLEKRRTFACLVTVAPRSRRRHEKKMLEMEQRSTTNGIFIYHLPTN